jgi:hypothetical protein
MSEGCAQHPRTRGAPRYHIDAAGPRIYTFAGKALTLEGFDVPGHPSLRGRFAGTDRVVVEEYHVHPRSLRDLSSYVALCLIGQRSGPAIPKNRGVTTSRSSRRFFTNGEAGAPARAEAAPDPATPWRRSRPSLEPKLHVGGPQVLGLLAEIGFGQGMFEKPLRRKAQLDRPLVAFQRDRR